jgi:hypothetical protein
MAKKVRKDQKSKRERDFVKKVEYGPDFCAGCSNKTDLCLIFINKGGPLPERCVRR